ncbi:FAD binding domain-containing protein [Hypoxylon trugodes]|uniref:FAD binding domain-containing protein n=1 Tax=Hypoxylon trugodes TaxID=326681 RepID=UPI00218FE934|nr:FAD binding domain-containing protein [Hypoxylon trugodes]KAI1392851.1 FAD binding domain-containing protein [Hypoxylon trugodes]
MRDGANYIDVLVVGAGPVGLITAFQLAKFGGISVRIVEKHVKSTQDAYGRAITLFPRTIEMLDQLGLADELLQSCFACRDTVTYNSDGQEVEGRGWSFMKHMGDTTFNFALVLRQKFQEEIFRNAMEKYGVRVETPVELTTASVVPSDLDMDYRITAVLLHHNDGVYETVRCKHLIGCDGGHSSVRSIFNIPFEGSASEDRWVRIDGQVKTNVPKPRSYCSIESPTHGNVLWAPLDRGATRIGFAFTDNRAEKYAKFDETAAVEEAIAAVKPFDVEFESVDWWTIYTVGQRIAKNFSVKDCIFLAGDACHTHSSGAAQGMNTGIHDAVNLAWKLYLTLRGVTVLDLLQTYQAERLPNVQRLIQYDKDISRLMTNRLPENWEGDPDTDVNVILGRLFKEAGVFTSGLGISYEMQKDDHLNVQGSFHGSQPQVKPGKRGPDVTLLRPGTFEPTRLIRELSNLACFYILIFAAERLPPIPKEIHDCELEDGRYRKFITILPRRGSSPYELLGGKPPLGHAYFDTEDQHAYRQYGISPKQGAVVILRPDGWIGTMVVLGKESIEEVEEYFRPFDFDE